MSHAQARRTLAEGEQAFHLARGIANISPYLQA